MTRPQRVEKLWGYEDWFANCVKPGYCGKVLGVKSMFRGSFHRHPIKDETFYAQTGVFVIEYSDEESGDRRIPVLLQPGDCLHIPPKRWHRINAVDRECPMHELIEVSTFHSDDDVERLETGGILSDEELMLLIRWTEETMSLDPREHA